MLRYRLDGSTARPRLIREMVRPKAPSTLRLCSVSLGARDGGGRVAT